ncbi:MAG: hypothetical protein NC401_16800 [Ruminococcus sp.]|nr:hypothetical protein [Ruminococcus sp.]
MNIVYKTPEAESSHIAFSVKGSKITFGDDEKTLNLAKFEKDDAVHITDSVDADGNLVGNSDGLYYAYEIDIPAREYEYTEDESGEQDENGAPKMLKIPVPFDIDKCTLTLWKLEV